MALERSDSVQSVGSQKGPEEESEDVTVAVWWGWMEVGGPATSGFSPVFSTLFRKGTMGHLPIYFKGKSQVGEIFFRFWRLILDGNVVDILLNDGGF